MLHFLLYLLCTMKIWSSSILHCILRSKACTVVLGLQVDWKWKSFYTRLFLAKACKLALTRNTYLEELYYIKLVLSLTKCILYATVADYEGLPIRIEKIRIAIQTADWKLDCQSICSFGLKTGFSIQFSINSVNPIRIDNPPENTRKRAYYRLINTNFFVISNKQWEVWLTSS